MNQKIVCKFQKTYALAKLFLFYSSLTFQIILHADAPSDESASLGYRQWSGKNPDVFSVGAKTQESLGTQPATPGIEQINSLLSIDNLENYVAQQKKVKILNQEVDLQQERAIGGVTVEKRWVGNFQGPVQYKNLLINNAKLIIDTSNLVLQISGDVPFFDLFNINVTVTIQPLKLPKPPRAANPNSIDKIKYQLEDATKSFSDYVKAKKDNTKIIPHFSQELGNNEKNPATDTDLRIIVEGKIPVNNLKPFAKTDIPGLKDITILDAIVLFDFSTALSLGIQIGCVCEILNTPVIGSIGVQKVADQKFAPVMKVQVPDEWSIGTSVPVLKNTPVDLVKFKDTQFIITTLAYVDEDMDGLSIKKGINVVSTLLPSGPLDKLTNLLGKPVSEMKVYGSISPDPKDVTIGVMLPFNIPFKNSRVRSGSVVFELTGEPSFDLKFILLVSPTDVDKLALIAKVEIKPDEALLSGTMQGEWDDPFGIVGLSVADLAVQTALSYTSPIAISGFGFTGKVKIGSKLMGIGMNVTTDPQDFIVYGQLEGSLSLADLLEFAQDIAKRALDVSKDPKKLGESSAATLAVSVTPLGPVVLGSLFAGVVVGNILGKVPPDVLPPISIDDPKLLVAPVGGTIGEIVFDKGITLKGAISILNQKFMVDFNVSFQGFWAKAAMSEILLGTSAFPLLRITGPGIQSSGGKSVQKGPVLDIEISSKDQHMLISGSMEILGMTQDTTLMLSGKGLSFSFTKNLEGFFEATISGQAPLDLKDPDFTVSILITTSQLLQMVKDAIRDALSKIPGIGDFGSAVIDPVLNAFALNKLEGTVRLKDLEKIKLPSITVDATLFGQSINFTIQADLSDPGKIKDFIVNGVLGKIKDAIWNLLKDPLRLAKLFGEEAAQQLLNSAAKIGQGLQKGADEIKSVASKGAQAVSQAAKQSVVVAQTAGIFLGDSVANEGKAVSQNVVNASKVAIDGISKAADAVKNAFNDLKNVLEDIAKAALGIFGIHIGSRKEDAEANLEKQIGTMITQATNYIATVISPLNNSALNQQNAQISIKKQIQQYYQYAAAAVADAQSKNMLAGYLKMLDTVRSSVTAMKQDTSTGINQINTVIIPTIDSIAKSIPSDMPNDDKIVTVVNNLNAVILQMRNMAARIISIFNKNTTILNDIATQPVGSGDLSKFKPELLNLSIIDSFRLAGDISKFYLSTLTNLSSQAKSLIDDINKNKAIIDNESSTGISNTSSQVLLLIADKAKKISDAQNQIQNDISQLNIIQQQAVFYQDLSGKLKDISLKLLDATAAQASGEIKTLIDLISKNKDLGASYLSSVQAIMSQPVLKMAIMNEQQIFNVALNSFINAKKLQASQEYNAAVQKQSQQDLAAEQNKIAAIPDWILSGGLAWVQQATEAYRNSAEDFAKLSMPDVMNTLNKRNNNQYDNVVNDITTTLRNVAVHVAPLAASLVAAKAVDPNQIQDFAKKAGTNISATEASAASGVLKDKINTLVSSYYTIILGDIVAVDMSDLQKTLGAEFDTAAQNLATEIGEMGGRSTTAYGNIDAVKALLMAKAVKSQPVKDVYATYKLQADDQMADTISRDVNDVLTSLVKSYQQKKPSAIRVVWTPPVQTMQYITKDQAIGQMDVAKLFAANPATKTVVINDVANNLKQKVPGVDIVGVNMTPAKFIAEVEQLLVQKATTASLVNSILQSSWPNNMMNNIIQAVKDGLSEVVDKFATELKAQNISVK